MRESYLGASPPRPDELEVHLFGRGYGEALAIHIGAGVWIAVDSALTLTGAPWLFEYFGAIGVDRSQVQDLIVTHWHTDHIRGAAEVLAQAASHARLILSNGGNSHEFMKMVAECSGSRADAAKASAFEMYELLQIIRARRQRSSPTNYRFVGRDTVLKSERIRDTTMTFLAPSELDCAAALAFFSGKGLRGGEVPSPYVGMPENHASVVLLVEAGDDLILLGGDRENHPDPERGWSIVLASKAALVPDKRASVNKIAHHGSVTGYCAELWPDHLEPNCIHILTPFTRLARPIPDREMLDRYKRHGSHVYCTSIPRRHRSGRSQRAIASARGPKILFEGKAEEGSIRLRKPKNAPSEPWAVTLFGAAERV